MSTRASPVPGFTSLTLICSSIPRTSRRLITALQTRGGIRRTAAGEREQTCGDYGEKKGAHGYETLLLEMKPASHGVMARFMFGNCLSVAESPGSVQLPQNSFVQIPMT